MNKAAMQDWLANFDGTKQQALDWAKSAFDAAQKPVEENANV